MALTSARVELLAPILKRSLVESIISTAAIPSYLAGGRAKAATILVIVVSSSLLKRFYADFYCGKTFDSDGRRCPSSLARRAGTLPRDFRSEQPPGSRQSFSIRFRR